MNELKNICLEHLLHKQRNLTRLEIDGVADGVRSICYFVDAHGYVSTSIEDSSEEARRDLLETLSYYGFRPPKTAESQRAISTLHIRLIILPLKPPHCATLAKSK